MVEPLLDDGLAIAARDADDRDVKLLAVAFCQSLQCFQRRWHFEVVGVGLGRVGHLADDEVAHSATIELADVAVSVVFLGAYGKKEGFLGEGQRTAVGQQPVDACVGLAYAVSADEGGDCFD